MIMAAELHKLAQLHTGQRREIALDLKERTSEFGVPDSLPFQPKRGLSFAENLMGIGEAIADFGFDRRNEDYISTGLLIRNAGERVSEFPSATFPGHRVEWGSWDLNPVNRRHWNVGLFVDDARVALGVREAQVLNHFIDNPNTFFSNVELIEHIWNSGAYAAGSATRFLIVTVTINHIRA